MKGYQLWVIIGVAALLPTVLALPGCVSKSDYETLQAQRAILAEENESLKTELERVQSDLANLQADYDALETEYNAIKNELAGTTSIPTTTPSTTIKLRRGQYLIAQDGTYLGTLDSGFASESIFNDFGDYGSKFSSTSIWNSFSEYGSKFSSLSAFNDLASKPPMLFDSGSFICYVTTNTLKIPGVSPYYLIAFAESMGWE
jgi:hypothetical protein